MNEFSKVAGYKTDIQKKKLNVFTYPSSEQLEIEIKNTIQ